MIWSPKYDRAIYQYLPTLHFPLRSLPQIHTGSQSPQTRIIMRDARGWLCLAQILVPAVLAAPAPVAAPTIAAGVVVGQQPSRPRVTEPPSIEGRDIFNNINSFVEGEWTTLGSRVSSFVVSGVPQFLAGFPTGDDVKKELGISDGDLDAKPTQVLNLPYVTWRFIHELVIDTGLFSSV